MDEPDAEARLRTDRVLTLLAALAATVALAALVLAHVPATRVVSTGARALLADAPPALLVGLALAVVVVRRARRRHGAAPATGLMTPSPRGRRREGRPARSDRPAGGVVVGGALVALLGLSVLGPGQVLPSWAAWTDTAPLTGGTLTAATVPAPTVSCGGLGILSTTLTWTAVSGATGYRVHHGSGGASVTTVGSGVLSVTYTFVQSGTFWVEAVHDYGSVTWTSAASNHKAYSVLLGLVGLCADA